MIHETATSQPRVRIKDDDAESPNGRSLSLAADSSMGAAAESSSTALPSSRASASPGGRDAGDERHVAAGQHSGEVSSAATAVPAAAPPAESPPASDPPGGGSVVVDGQAVAGRRYAGGAPVVVCCGLVGGVGTTTVAYLLARQIAREDRSVLLCEAQAAAGGLARLAGAHSPLGVWQLAEALHNGWPVPGEPFVEPEPGLRVITASERIDMRRVFDVGDRLADVVAQAAASHDLVVVDAGTLAGFEAPLFAELASDIVWVAPSRADAPAVASMLTGPLAPELGDCSEKLVVSERRRGLGRGVSRDRLRHLVAQRCSRIVAIPYVDELAAGELELDPRHKLAVALHHVRPKAAAG